MTQVANLTAGMAASAKGDAAFRKHDQSQLAIEEFASIMNRNAQNFRQTGTDFCSGSGGSSDDCVSMSDLKDGIRNNYEKFGSSGKRKITQAKAECTDASAMEEKVQELAGEVKETIQETMQVSEEDLEAAMEALGLNVMDLLQPQNLILLVQKITGSADVSALLTDAGFQMTMQEVTGLISGFQQENGFSAEQFSDLLEQLSVQIDELEDTVKEFLGMNDGMQSEQTAGGQTDGLMQEMVSEPEVQADIEQAAAKTLETVQQQNPTVQSTQEEPQNESEQVTGQPVTIAAEETEETSGQSTDQEEHPAFQGEKNKQQPLTTATEQEHNEMEQHVGIFRENTVVTNTQTVTTQPEVQNYVDLQQLMEQMEGLAKTFASAEGTTVEMQLNPESLGRLVLTVTEKHGNVTAQIAASNEQVKEALQTQMVELRSTLQAQGLKVEAVEVTVATHEFEQNLDGNASANGQMQEQAEGQSAGQQSGRRNLNRNSLDELSGLMSEEEILAAQMMRDNGGTVDFTA